MEKGKRREIKRIRQILSEIIGMAEDDELEGGLGNAVKRYNAIVRHLEVENILPPALFQPLEEDKGSTTFHQVGAESRMLSGYLEEVVEEEEEKLGKPDFSPVIALAPFLDQSDLKALIQSHLSGRGFASVSSERSGPNSGPPSLRALVELAPHMPSQDLADLVEACLARDPSIDQNDLVALAPHLKSQDLGRIIRRHAPQWFDSHRPDVSAGQEPGSQTNPLSGDWQENVRSGAAEER